MKLQRATYELLKPSKLEEVVSLKLGFETPHVKYFSYTDGSEYSRNFVSRILLNDSMIKSFPKIKVS